VERQILIQDSLVQLAELATGLDPELVDERASCRLVDVERLRVASGAVEREHQLPPQPLAQRVVRDEGLELGDQRMMMAELQLGIESLLDGLETQLLESGDLDSSKTFVRKVRERPT